MLEYLQIISLSLTYIGYFPEIYNNYINPKDSKYNQIYLWLIWTTASLSTSVYVTVNNIDFLVSINCYGNMICNIIILSQKIYNIVNNKECQVKNIAELQTDTVVSGNSV